MKVKELVEQLQKQDQEKSVVIYCALDDDGFCNIDKIELGINSITETEDVVLFEQL